jgi:hypothetical protein
MDGGTSLNSVSVGVAEIKLLTSAMPAEYGYATAGALIVVKKSGTNTLHGQGGYLFKSTSMMPPALLPAGGLPPYRQFIQFQQLFDAHH